MKQGNEEAITSESDLDRASREKGTGRAQDGAIGKMLTRPLETSTDRRALVAYSTWLDQERRHLCFEMYPHLGWKASTFVVGDNSGWNYHRRATAPASTRAEAVLTLAGCDWSGDGFLGIGESERDKNSLTPQSGRFPHPDARLMDLEPAFLNAHGVLKECDAACRAAQARFDQQEAEHVKAERDLIMHEPVRRGLPPLYWRAEGVRRLLMGDSYGGSARDFEVAAQTPKQVLEAMLPRLEAREGRRAALEASLDMDALEEARDDAADVAAGAAERVYRYPAHTLDGLAIKTRVLRADYPELWTRPGYGVKNPADWHEIALTDIADGVEHLLSVRGLPGGSAVHDDGLPAGVFADLVAISGGDPRDDGTVCFTDALGKVLYKPTADWIAHTAARLWTHARTEMSRQLCDPALSDDDRAALSVRLRHDLRIDALHTLVFRSGEASDAGIAQDETSVAPAIPLRRVRRVEGVSPDLQKAVEAHREAVQLAIHDPVADRERFETSRIRIRKLADALRATPVRSVADLRHKVIYLWPGNIEGETVTEDLSETLTAFEHDVMHLGAEINDDGETTDDTEEWARKDFEVWDLAGPCPVPSNDDWISSAPTILPWLRMGLCFLSLQKSVLVTQLREMPEEEYTTFIDNIHLARRNFDQLHNLTGEILNRMMIGLSALSLEADATDAVEA